MRAIAIIIDDLQARNAMLDFESRHQTGEVPQMWSGSARRWLGRGSFLLSCNIVLGMSLLPRAWAQEPAATSQNPTPAQKSQSDTDKKPAAPATNVGSFEEGTEKPDSQVESPAPAPQPTSVPDKPANSAADIPSSRLTLGPGDLVEVSVYGVPELSTKARIGDNGDLYLPLINYVHVEDLSVDEAQKLIEKRFADGGFVRDPHVTVLIDEYASQAISMLGEVSKPGAYPIYGEHRLFDMITAAGGLTDKAGRKVTIRHRNDPDKVETVELSRNLNDKPESNVPVYPGDTIEVQRAPIIYVVGDVGRPSGILVDNGTLTVLQALALAGGTNHTAKLNDTRILRKSSGPTGLTETRLPLKKMLEAKAPDVPLEPNDILFIPRSGAKVVAARSFDAAMAITTGVVIYAAHP
jgi:polysaccharide export outer membrane protein